MTKKEILEIKKQFTPENVSISKIYGCYVDAEKNIKTRMKEAFLSLSEEECFKYYEIFKKNLSGTIGKNLINLEFPMEQEKEGGTQEFLLKLRNSGLKDDPLITEFFEKIIESYKTTESYYIILVHAVYDIPGKSSEGSTMFDTSDEIYNHILCSICPVKLSKAGLGYNAENNNIEDIQGDWLVSMPAHGFLFPAFNDRSADIHNLLFYTKKPDDLQEGFVNDFLGCQPPSSAAKQAKVFQAAMKEALGTDCNLEHVMNFQEKFSEWEDGHREENEISKDELGRILEESGATEEQADVFRENLTTEENSLSPNSLLNKKITVETYGATIKLDSDCGHILEQRVMDGRKCLVLWTDSGVKVNGIELTKVL